MWSGSVFFIIWSTLDWVINHQRIKDYYLLVIKTSLLCTTAIITKQLLQSAIVTACKIWLYMPWRATIFQLVVERRCKKIKNLWWWGEPIFILSKFWFFFVARMSVCCLFCPKKGVPTRNTWRERLSWHPDNKSSSSLTHLAGVWKIQVLYKHTPSMCLGN